VGVGSAWAPPTSAEVKDYQIRRLIYIYSSCNLDANSLKRTENKNKSLHFHGRCKNASFYPDGIEVTCPDKEYELHCKIQTESLSFDHLNLLQDSVDQGETDKK